MSLSNPKIPVKPKGFAAVTAVLSVADVEAAITFYSEVLGAAVVEKLTAPDGETIVHAHMKVGGAMLALTMDRFARPHAGVGHVTLHHYLDNADATFDRAVSAGAVPVSPVAASWWGERCGVVIDPFGVRWSLAQRIEQLNAQNRQSRLNDLYAASEPDAAPDAPEAPEVVAQG